jgi:hypothetical protein
VGVGIRHDNIDKFHTAGKQVKKPGQVSVVSPSPDSHIPDFLDTNLAVTLQIGGKSNTLQMASPACCRIWAITVLLFLIHFIMAGATTAIIDCVALSALVPGRVHLKNTAQYTTATTSYFAAFENELRPVCVIEPTTAKELGKVVKYLASVLGQGKVAIKGGGHTAWAGAANIEDGVLISMHNFKKTVVNSSAGTVKIGAGERWGDVYSTLNSQGLAVAGGRVSKVGVSGLILGG